MKSPLRDGREGIICMLPETDVPGEMEIGEKLWHAIEEAGINHQYDGPIPHVMASEWISAPVPYKTSQICRRFWK